MSYDTDDVVNVLEQRGLCSDVNDLRRKFGDDVLNKCMSIVFESRDPAAAAEDFVVWLNADDRQGGLDKDALFTRAHEAAAVTRTKPV